MLARVALADGTDLSTHQTYLTPDGRKAPLGEQTRLFPAGSKTTGGGVWLGEVDKNREFIVGEGIESTLSAMRIFSADAGCAALSAFGVSRLILPPEARAVRIFADHDSFGQGLASARVAVQRWRAEGREVAVMMSPTPARTPTTSGSNNSEEKDALRECGPHQGRSSKGLSESVLRGWPPLAKNHDPQRNVIRDPCRREVGETHER